jgi:iron(III) transport system permease protein
MKLTLDRAVLGGAVLVLLYLISAPLLMTVFTAFRGPVDFLPFESGAQFTLDNLREVYSSGIFRETLKDTAWFVSGSTALAFVLSFALAFLVERTNLPCRDLVFLLLTLPIMLPPLITGLSWIFLLGKSRGLLNVLLRGLLGLDGTGPFDVFTWYGMILAQGLAVVPFMFLLMGGAMRRMDPALEEASLVAGCGWLHTLTRVTLPVLRPAMLSILLLTAIITLEAFDIPLLLGLGAGARVLATSVYYPLYPQIGLPRYGEVAAIALLFLAITYALVYLYARATREQARYATVTGKGFRPRQINLGRWRYVALAGIGLYLCVQVALPAFVLLWSSLLDGYRPPTDWSLVHDLSLKSFGKVLRDTRFLPALRNTVLVAALSATIVAVLAAIMAWMVVRSQVRGKRLLDLLASTSIAIPSVIAGVSFLLFYLAMPGVQALGLYGTVWVLVLALSYRTSVGYRITSAGVSQIKRELEEAAAVCGASWLTMFRRVVLPLLLPTTLAVWLLIFIVNFREFTIALLLGGVDNQMLGPLLWRYVASSEMGQASALAVLMAAMLLTVGGLARRVVLARFGA